LKAAWFQPLNLECKLLVLRFACTFNLYRYVEAVQFWSDRWRFSAVGLGAVDGWYQGAMPRWWVHFNLLTLRLIGYGMDLHWRRAADKAGNNHNHNGNNGISLTSILAAAPAAAASLSSSSAAAGGGAGAGLLASSSSSSTSPAAAAAAAATAKNAAAGGGGGYFHLVEHPSADVSYSLLEYVAFLFYPPLYIAGPTSSFNAFASQLYTVGWLYKSEAADP
jgi:D-alanyl-lipoteichoic acid acyltransferase DltB (MBOAT superfamily)